jgi:hypothetical protein
VCYFYIALSSNYLNSPYPSKPTQTALRLTPNVTIATGQTEVRTFGLNSDSVIRSSALFDFGSFNLTWQPLRGCDAGHEICDFTS